MNKKYIQFIQEYKELCIKHGIFIAQPSELAASCNVMPLGVLSENSLFSYTPDNWLIGLDKEWCDITYSEKNDGYLEKDDSIIWI